MSEVLPESGGTKVLKTDRLVLRRHVISDADWLYEHIGCDEGMFEYTGWNPYATLEDAREMVQHFIDSYNDENFYGWAIELDRDMIGTIGAYDFDAVKNCIEVGISICRYSWGKGYAPETMREVLRYLTEERNIRTAKAWCAGDNLGSRKVMEKCGMKLVSVDKDALQVGDVMYDKLNYEYESDR
ncbi:MAG: GNAT family N-acetyltransferase [Eubacterium sp.]|nr:GNAT family N-acetyltransferase [Eubacterium sp.]